MRSSVLAIFFLAACGGAETQPGVPDAGVFSHPPDAAPVQHPADAVRSSLAVDRTSAVLADGQDHAMVTITVRDASGTPLRGVHVSFEVAGAGASLSAAPDTDAGGTTTAALTATSAGTKTVAALAGGVRLAATADVAFAAPQRALAFKTIPGGVNVAGSPLSPAVQVQISDGGTESITLVLAQNPSGATFTGTRTVAAVAGVATFSDLRLDQGGTFTLTASAPNAQAATSGGFKVIGPPAALAFVVQPGDTDAGSAITPAPKVKIVDAAGDLVPNATLPVSVVLGNNPVGGTLSGSRVFTAVSGVATLSGLSIDRAASGYTLVASASGVSNVSSTGFAVRATAAARLVFTVQPTGATAAATMATVRVAVQDRNGNAVTSATNTITLTLATNPGAGTLSGTTTVNAASGVADFGNLALDKVGQGYTLMASASSLTYAVSTSFDVTVGLPAKLAFLVQPPAGAYAMAPLTPAVQVAIVDAGGNRTTAGAPITLALSSSSNGVTLFGTKTVTAVAGVARFDDLAVDKADSGYTLSATSGALTAGRSRSFAIVTGPTAVVRFTAEPEDTRVGVVMPPITVALADAGGNPVVGAEVTIAIGRNPGAGTLRGAASASTDASGTFTFTGLSIDKPGPGYTLTATAGAVQTESTPFVILPLAWARTVIGIEGGDITSVAMDPVVPGNLYATTSSRLYRSVDAGATWIDTPYLGNAAPRHLVVDPRDPAHVVAACQYWLCTSRDHGVTWSKTEAFALQGSIEHFAVAPGAPDRMAALVHGGYLYLSTDGGGTWTLQALGVEAFDVIFDTSPSPALLVAASDGVHRSTDGGTTWKIAAGAQAYVLRADPTHPGRIYGVDFRGRGVTSGDGGGSFTVGAAIDPGGGTVMDLAVDPADGAHLVAAMDHGAFVTRDGGNTWTRLAAAFPFGTRFETVAFDPTRPGRLFLGAIDRGLWLSTDGGGSFTAINTGLSEVDVRRLVVSPRAPLTLYAQTGTRLFRSRDGAATWTALDLPVAYMLSALQIDPQAPDHLLVSAGLDDQTATVMRSTDGGDTFRPSTTTPEGWWSQLTIDPANGQVVYGSDPWGRLWKSIDGGLGFAQVGAGLAGGEDILVIRVDPAHPSTVYVVTFSTVNRSSDGGASFTPIMNGLPSGGLWPSFLELDPFAQQPWLGVNLSSPLLTFEAGTWRGAGALVAATCMAFDPIAQGTQYVGSFGGVSKSTDGGATWRDASAGLTFNWMGALVVDPSNPSVVYAGTSFGVYKSTTGGE